MNARRHDLWLLERIYRVHFDEAIGFVVAAETEAEARSLASQDAGDEGQEAWLNPWRSTCECIGEASQADARVVLRSFRSG